VHPFFGGSLAVAWIGGTKVRSAEGEESSVGTGADDDRGLAMANESRDVGAGLASAQRRLARTDRRLFHGSFIDLHGV